MKVMILEDDELIADLLESLVCGLHADMHVVKARSLTEAEKLWSAEAADSLLCDWNLPDGSGLKLVRNIRKTNNHAKVVMITARSDKESVVQAARCKVNGFITKPFDIEEVHKRLKTLLLTSEAEDESTLDIQQMLSRRSRSLVQLPGEIDSLQILTLIAQKDSLSPVNLAREWRDMPAVTARLLDIANNYSMGRSGKAIHTLNDAVATLGTDMSLSHVLAMSLDISATLTHPYLAELAGNFKEQAEKVAKTATILAEKVNADSQSLYVAGLLSRIGELGVLKVLQDINHTGVKLQNSDIDLLVKDWAKVFGNKLKIQWRLPLPLRNLIGAVHLLPEGASNTQVLIMHVAALSAQGQLNTPPAQKLLRQIGITANTTILQGEKG
ncbi:response regulator [Lacimicrobium alkaliphilum]|uniref:Response regulator n=1 Tax=Lacimicrobium alkaliphilum TaxID=1526571 RepID=A0ABQ1RBI4_9ALTE|nr:response regulator [Lacimicrobium alkaliphilum]GGD61111.1 response regulator [Lacimicrobium alkaliphilum]